MSKSLIFEEIPLATFRYNPRCLQPTHQTTMATNFERTLRTLEREEAKLRERKLAARRAAIEAINKVISDLKLQPEELTFPPKRLGRKAKAAAQPKARKPRAKRAAAKQPAKAAKA